MEVLLPVKVFSNGSQQLIILPPEITIQGNQIFAYQNEDGEIILKTQKSKEFSWEKFFSLPVPECELERPIFDVQSRSNPFEDWEE